MKSLFIAITLLSISLTANGQDKSYWKDAPVTGIKIYSILFSDENTGMAISAQNDYFFTSDKGETWLHINEHDGQIFLKPNSGVKWSADVFCSVMHTNDGGENWSPYNKKQQDHFCALYLKDQNVGYKTGCDFLRTVTANIIASMNNGAVNTLRTEPQQCTEYFSDENSGWALGWSAQFNIL
jgi:hypothetical protein